MKNIIKKTTLLLALCGSITGCVGENNPAPKTVEQLYTACFKNNSLKEEIEKKDNARYRIRSNAESSPESLDAVNAELIELKRQQGLEVARCLFTQSKSVDTIQKVLSYAYNKLEDHSVYFNFTNTVFDGRSVTKERILKAQHPYNLQQEGKECVKTVEHYGSATTEQDIAELNNRLSSCLFKSWYFTADDHTRVQGARAATTNSQLLRSVDYVENQIRRQDTFNRWATTITVGAGIALSGYGLNALAKSDKEKIRIADEQMEKDDRAALEKDLIEIAKFPEDNAKTWAAKATYKHGALSVDANVIWAFFNEVLAKKADKQQ